MINFMNAVSVGIATVVFISPALSLGASGEVTGFRYTTCEANKCISVEAPKAWLSQSNGSFVAAGDEGVNGEPAKMKMIEDGQQIREFRGTEIVSQPQIDAMTIESNASVILVGVKNSSIEVVEKRGRN